MLNVQAKVAKISGVLETAKAVADERSMSDAPALSRRSSSSRKRKAEAQAEVDEDAPTQPVRSESHGKRGAKAAKVEDGDGDEKKSENSANDDEAATIPVDMEYVSFMHCTV